MKKLTFIFLLTIVSNASSAQKLNLGLYESKEGSTLELKNGTFLYKRSSEKVESDIIALWPEYEAYGTYKQKGNSLFLTSKKLKLKNNPERGINLSIKEKTLKSTMNWNDTSIVSLKYDKDLISVYLCNTLNEQRYNSLDDSNCLKMDDINYLRYFSGDFFIRIYPNLDNHSIRTLQKINTISFDSEYHDKDPFSDLEIDISFDVNNFCLVFFEDEQFQIKRDKIYHNGQEFVLTD